MLKLNNFDISKFITIFPDKTSQVWKLPDEYFLDTDNVVTWEFENEAEFLHLSQLKFLLDHKTNFNPVILDMPYLPYARQDKPITNTATFALMPFFYLLDALGFSKVKVFDPHNVELVKNCIDNVEVEMPDLQPLVSKLISKPVYPDKGAASRYCTTRSSVVFDKDREPSTGAIKGIKLVQGTIEPRSYLIVDDICDGGRTFIEVANKLYDAGATEVHLYVSHGLFSKGLSVLRDAGIKRIFTRKGEVL